jgi:hypothetical protein
VSLAAADLDGDGFADIITGAGAGGGPHVKVFSGKDGSLLRSFWAYAPAFRGGVTVAAGDINGDGRADIVTGAGAGGGPHVKAFDGTDLTVLHSFFAFDSTFLGGVSVSAADFDGDGRADIVTGAGAGDRPTVQVYGGKDGTLIRSFLAFYPVFTGGVRVAVSDINGDGRPDIVTGGGAGPFEVYGTSENNVFDGQTGRLLRNFSAFDPAFLGGVFVG